VSAGEGYCLLEPYKILDHEADAGFEVHGHTEEELFHNAACALFSLITDLGAIRPETEKHVEITGNGESLIVFLNELLYLWDVEKFIPKTIAIIREGVSIQAILRGEILDEHRHTVVGAVKAVTYHKFSIRKEEEMLKATFIVDT
jgi:SHS2 domain-containing protein